MSSGVSWTCSTVTISGTYRAKTRSMPSFNVASDSPQPTQDPASLTNAMPRSWSMLSKKTSPPSACTDGRILNSITSSTSEVRLANSSWYSDSYSPLETFAKTSGSTRIACLLPSTSKISASLTAAPNRDSTRRRSKSQLYSLCFVKEAKYRLKYIYSNPSSWSISLIRGLSPSSTS